jgi:serine/threonine protein kinase
LEDRYSSRSVLTGRGVVLPPDGVASIQGRDTAQKIAKHRQAPPPSVRDIRPEVSVELDELIKRLLAKSPDERPRIPLLIVNPLRKLASGAMNATGSDSRASIPALRPSVSNR